MQLKESHVEEQNIIMLLLERHNVVVPMVKLCSFNVVKLVGFKFLSPCGFWVYKKSGKSSCFSSMCLSSNFEVSSVLESLHWIEIKYNQDQTEI